MARKKNDTSSYTTFEDVANRLDQIVEAVRDKDLSLEKSLDLFDEAIALGSRAVDLVDSTDFSPTELQTLAEMGVGSSQSPAREGDEASVSAADNPSPDDQAGTPKSPDSPAEE